MPTHLIIMGVSGSGKTTAAELLEKRTGVPYAEADSFHPEANKKKMASGEPLNDDDRWPWLRKLRDWMTEQAEQGNSTIVTCSALKVAYRDVLREATGDERFVLLNAPEDVLATRMDARKGHYMPTSLLRSQLDTLEPLTDDENGVTLDATADPEDIIQQVLDLVGDFGASDAGPDAEPDAEPDAAGAEK
ncbi:MAG TPA: gluconokinase [Candidatus Corynebacterium avicola]|uniref:Gluconokinase n=1 Tax=Candidatus Corynebacterium avicola TaxID=2838527 RepID=A0A9D1UM72_9CORY|nr:gluconokinase [Candidatus Corynebacterium avicola]